VWDKSEVRGDSASTDWQSILPQIFSKQAKESGKQSKRLCSLAHNAKNVEQIDLHNKREDSIDFKSMLQVLDHDPDTRIQQEVNISTTSPELFRTLMDVMF